MEKREYTVAELGVTECTPEDILSGTLDEEIRNRMETVVETEAPVRRSILYKRLIYSFGMQKVGSRIIDVFDSLAAALPYEATEDANGETVFHYGSEEYFRPTPESEVRYSYQIPYEEGANCLLYILENTEKTSLSKTELKERFMEEMGWLRYGSQVEELFEASWRDSRIRRSGNGRFLSSKA